MKDSSWVLKVFSERFLLKDTILKDSFLKDYILKDPGFVEKSDSERFHSERFCAPHHYCATPISAPASWTYAGLNGLP
jgi:hypothetical protein